LLIRLRSAFRTPHRVIAARTVQYIDATLP
jgi:hypothetical protein